jgi:hypothetical protein
LFIFYFDFITKIIIAVTLLNAKQVPDKSRFDQHIVKEKELGIQKNTILADWLEPNHGRIEDVAGFKREFWLCVIGLVK